MNKIKQILPITLLFLFIILLFNNNYILIKSVIDGTNLWLTKVFPSLFIMFILNDIIINLNLLSILNKYINPIFNKIFKTTKDSSNAFLLSVFSGTPSAAFIIKEMMLNKKININDANKLISFTFFSNPLFLYNILNQSFNKFITIKIIIIHYISNIIIGLIMNYNYLKKDINKYNEINNSNNKNIFILLPKSIKKSLDTLLMILGTIVFYMIITNLITSIIPISNTLDIIIKGLLEITQSLNMLPTLNINSLIKEIIAISIISFGGLSIHTQVLSIINDTKINYKNFFIGRILHVLISANTYLLINLCIPS